MSDGMMQRPAWVGEPGVSPSRPLLDHEWLVTNGCGGYSSSTVGAVMTRKYHGYLVAALPSPFGRMVMLQDLRATVRLADGTEVTLSGAERADGGVQLPSARCLTDFRLEMGLPVWEYLVSGVMLRKRLVMPFSRNTVYVTWERFDTGSAPCTLLLRPFLHVRSYEAPVTTSRNGYKVSTDGAHMKLEVPGGMATLRVHASANGATFEHDEVRVGEVAYRVERDRGYEWVGEDWSPGRYVLPVMAGETVSLVATTEAVAPVDAANAPEAFRDELARRRQLIEIARPLARDAVGIRLTLAADQFIISPAGRAADTAFPRQPGDEPRTVIAGYHWFADWGRDTMISLEGLTLCTGRDREASFILRTFAHYMRDGLIPNMFPDGAAQGLYHTADATLWFFHAMHRYVRTTGDRETLRVVLPVLREIVRKHLEGTHFGIHVDHADGLLTQGQKGYQLTWMDAKVDDWVVTPRRGKAVEINALWYNALRILELFEREEGEQEGAAQLAEHARRARESFNQRFWNPETRHLFDIVDGEDGSNDPACRPNQIFAVSLDYPVLDEEHWSRVLDVVRERLLTPYGLRSLAPGHPDYKPRYYGDLRARDAAYHQGTVWGWLVGPYVDAYLRVYPDDHAGARAVLSALVAHLDDFGVGSIAEVFDAEAPFTPRGCIAQAWSVAETLRAWTRTTPSPRA